MRAPSPGGVNEHPLAGIARPGARQGFVARLATRAASALFIVVGHDRRMGKERLATVLTIGVLVLTGGLSTLLVAALLLWSD